MVETPSFNRKLGKKNSGLIINLPREITNWLNLKPGKEVVLQPEIGKYGRYFSVYLKDGEYNDSDTKTIR